MSALPVGTLRLFELFIDKKGSQPEGDGRMISATDWIEGMKAAVEVVLEEVPDAANPDLGAGARRRCFLSRIRSNNQLLGPQGRRGCQTTRRECT